MTLLLLSTKFNPPATCAQAVKRPRLVQILDDSLHQNFPLILVCGPAGYGKTTVVGEWLQASKNFNSDQVAWLTLESGDNDLTRFLTYFITALQHIRPGLGEGVLKMLQTHKASHIPVLATMLINELSEISGSIILVLDDFHLLTDGSIQRFIEFIINHQPPQMRLVLITRTDPLLPLARLRARGQLVELRQSELCFSPEEVEIFTNQEMGLELSSDQVALLTKQTEGWISGLRLAAIAMREIQDRSAFLKNFSGEHEFIADYLTEEVLVRLPESVRTFLLQTSILERLTSTLCEAVTECPGAQDMLDFLMDENLFIVALDSQNIWYRYHALFADLLCKRLQTTQGDLILDLHHRASRWHRENGQIDLAINHAIASQDYDLAASLIENIAENYLMVGRATTLLGWLETLPKKIVLRQPILGPLEGFALILCNRPLQEAIDLLQQISNTDSLSEFQGEAITLHAFLAILQGKSTEAIHLSEIALQQLPAGRVFFRSLAADSLGMGHTLAGDFAAASQAFEQVVEISSQSGNFMMEIMALTNLAGLRYIQGQLRAGISTCRQALELANLRIGRLTPMVGKTLLNLGEMVREQGDLSAAFQFLSDAARLMDEFIEIGLPVAYLSLAKLKINQKDWQSAQQYIDQARQRARETRSTQMDDRLVEIVQARLWIRTGDLAKATLWARDCGILDRSPAELIGEMSRNAAISEVSQVELLNLARLYMEKQQPRQALELLDALNQYNEERNINRRPLEFLILKALAFHQMHKTEPALEFLRKALLLGEPEGYQTTFVDEGQPMAQLLYQAMTQNICPVYSGRLLKVLSEMDPVFSSTQEKNSDLIEPLSQRELEVLGLIVEGLSNAEIARTLYLSLSTVKGHTTNIYGKLGIKNRTQAVAQAQKFGFLSASKK